MIGGGAEANSYRATRRLIGAVGSTPYTASRPWVSAASAAATICNPSLPSLSRSSSIWSPPWSLDACISPIDKLLSMRLLRWA
jgi:hypothetical protein